MEEGFVWVDEETFQKAYGQAQLRVLALLNTFDCYGLGDCIPPITKEIMKVMVDFSMIVRGEDRPYKEIRTIPKPTE